VFELYKLLMVLYQKLEYELELITPAFIGGAFPQERAELRPASFIGILRWWFRNLALTVTDDINAVYNLESELFGNTEKAGKVWVRFREIIMQNYEEFRKNLFGGIDISNLTYLGYGNFSFVNCEKNQYKYPHICNKNPFFKGITNVKAFIPSGTTTKLTLLVPKKYEKLIKNLLYIVSQFGAIGGRNRRGWGNFYLNPLSGKDYWKPCKVKEVYESFISELCKYIPKGNPLQVIKVYEENYEKINPLEVLNEVGINYKGFRNRYKPDYNQAKDFLQNRHRFPTVIYNRAWFGLPIIARYKSLGGKTATINIFHRNQQERKDQQERLASPIIFRIFKDKNERFGILFIVFHRPKFFLRERKFYKWSFGKNREIKIKGRGIKPVVMNLKFEDFVCEFLKAMNTSTQPVLTLP